MLDVVTCAKVVATITIAKIRVRVSFLKIFSIVLDY